MNEPKFDFDDRKLRLRRPEEFGVKYGLQREYAKKKLVEGDTFLKLRVLGKNATNRRSCEKWKVCKELKSPGQLTSFHCQKL